MDEVQRLKDEIRDVSAELRTAIMKRATAKRTLGEMASASTKEEAETGLEALHQECSTLKYRLQHLRFTLAAAARQEQ